MEETLGEVAVHCRLQLEQFATCVAEHERTGDWDAMCRRERMALTRCSEENVGVLKHVKRECSAAVSAYDDCLAKNQAHPERECVRPLRDLHDCTNRVSAEYRAAATAPPPRKNEE